MTGSEAYLVIGVMGLVAAAIGATPLLLARWLAPRKPGAIKCETYECGVEATGDPWIPMKIRFYLFALAFVIFDAEVLFLFPWAAAQGDLGLASLVKMTLFVLLLASGLLWAWGRGLLRWE